jgi:hypothetical protein
MRWSAGAFLLMLLSGPAWADLEVRFREAAPKDRFTIRNAGACAVLWIDLTIDLSGSPYGLVFDVTGAGPGVNTFQPFEAVAGEAFLDGVPEVTDGDTSVSFSLRGLGPNQHVVFTADIDDTAGPGASTVSPTEIFGATVRAEGDHGASEARFGLDAAARLPVSGCVS